MMENLTVSSNPHIRHSDTSRGIMADVIIALTPALIGGTVLFGPRVLLVALVCIASSVGGEYLFCRLLKKENPIGDLSAIVTGLLLALNLPVTIPLWMAAIGGIAASVIVKQFFGGIGQNFANPAITARIILLVSFPAAMTNWVSPFGWLNGTEAISSATPLASALSAAPDPNAAYSLADLFFGRTPGCIGETSALLLLIGGVYLLIRRAISPIIPLSYILTLGLISGAAAAIKGGDASFFVLFGNGALISVLSGGVMLGAIFMATDYVTSPNNNKGRLIFGIGCGILTFIIRCGSLPEGVSYSILLMNILTPHINRLTASKPFGWEAKKNG